MTIDNHCGGDDQFHASSASHAEAHSRVALEQSALFAARLAIARWANAAGAPPLAQAGWYAQAQHDFQQWLGRGGFAQYADDCADLAPTMYTLDGNTAHPAASDIPSAAA